MCMFGTMLMVKASPSDFEYNVDLNRCGGLSLGSKICHASGFNRKNLRRKLMPKSASKMMRFHSSNDGVQMTPLRYVHSYGA